MGFLFDYLPKQQNLLYYRFGNRDYPEVQAEYAIVKFNLSYNSFSSDTEVYIYGALSNYELNENYKLKYNPETKHYELLLLLKQGYYNYRYVSVKKDSSLSPDHSFFEGSHRQTENNYVILVYHRGPSDSYDKLVSYEILNSVR